MEKEYMAFKCPVCGNTSIYLTSEMETTLRRGKYMSCGHCGFRDLQKVEPYDDLIECMRERKYERIHGRLRQK